MLHTGLEFPLISFGGACLSGEGGGYGFGPMDEATAEKLIKESFECGMTVFDTAPIYGFGLSEERLGRYLPQEALVVSKAGVDWHENKRVNMTNHPDVVERMLHQSLKRLKRETIDFYLLHWPDPRVDVRESLAPLIKAQAMGKIRFLGLANATHEQLQLAQEVAGIHLIQSEFNLFKPDILTDSISFMGWGTLDKGILTARVNEKRQFEKEDARSWAPWWKKQNLKQKIEATEKLNQRLMEYSYSLLQMCLSHGYYENKLTTQLVGMKSMDDLASIKNFRPIPEHHFGEILDYWRNSCAKVFL